MRSGWAIVTGASSGVGLAFARELSRRGYPVLAVARRGERLEALAKEAIERGSPIEPLTADLTTDGGLGSLVGRVQELDQIDLLINNAGVATAGDFLGATIEEELAQIRLNVEAVATLTHAVLPGMVHRRRHLFLGDCETRRTRARH